MAAAVTAALFEPQVEHSQVTTLRAHIEDLEEENERLREQLFLARIRAGEVDKPETIESENDAVVWLEWARANHHLAGCSCRRCIVARRFDIE